MIGERKRESESEVIKTSLVGVLFTPRLKCPAERRPQDIDHDPVGLWVGSQPGRLSGLLDKRAPRPLGLPALQPARSLDPAPGAALASGEGVADSALLQMPNNKRKLSQNGTTGEVDTYQVRTIQKKRTTNFREDETKLLISLWGSPVIQNKLYLTHRKAPVMRLLAANMQQRGFCRTPDEIKTRIRNLKCLYHRIKRTMVTGSGIGTVDPDWPHFKAMDAILGKEGKNKDEKKPGYSEESALEGPRCEDIKQELDIDINDDMESWTGNESLGGSDYEENHIPASSIAKPIQEPPAPSMAQMTAQLPSVLPLPAPAPPPTALAPLRPNGAIPLPLLILNHGLPPQQPAQPPDNKLDSGGSKSNEHRRDEENQPSDLVNILREILNVQTQQFELEKQKFELEKQKLDFDRVVGTQLMTLVPMVGGLLQRLVYPPLPTHSHIQTADSVGNEAESKAYQEKQIPEYDILKDSKILRTVLERGIKKYMMADETRDSNKDNDDDSDNEDSGVNNNLLIDNDNSNSNSK